MVKHMLHFYVDSERIDYSIEYEKLSGEEFPTTIKICRSVFKLKSTNFVIRENQVHIYGHYETILKKVAEDILI